MNEVLLIITILLLSIFYVCIKKKSKVISTIFLFVIIGVLSIVFAYREYFFPELMGYDYYSYKEWFENRTLSNYTLKFENIGYNTLIIITKFIFNDFHIFLLICSIIINFFIINYIKEKEHYFILLLMTYICLFYFSTYNVMRQWMACAIFLSSFNYLQNNNFKKYAVGVILASTFHASALLLLLLYPIINGKMKYIKKVAITILVGIIAYFGYSKIITVLMNVSSLIGVNYLSKYASTDSSFEIGNYTLFIIELFLFLGISIFYKKNDKNKDKLMILLLIATVFSLLKTRNFIFNRISIYFSISILTCFPLLIETVKTKSRLVLKLFVYILLIYSVIS